jgi:hypothetical protein
MAEINISVPGVVYYEALDPLTTQVPQELGLPTPRSRKQGKGRTFFYDGLTTWQAEEVAAHLHNHAETLWGSTDPMERSALRACSTCAQQIAASLHRAAELEEV